MALASARQKRRKYTKVGVTPLRLSIVKLYLPGFGERSLSPVTRSVCVSSLSLVVVHRSHAQPFRLETPAQTIGSEADETFLCSHTILLSHFSSSFLLPRPRPRHHHCRRRLCLQPCQWFCRVIAWDNLSLCSVPSFPSLHLSFFSSPLPMTDCRIISQEPQTSHFPRTPYPKSLRLSLSPFKGSLSTRAQAAPTCTPFLSYSPNHPSSLISIQPLLFVELSVWHSSLPSLLTPRSSLSSSPFIIIISLLVHLALLPNPHHGR